MSLKYVALTAATLALCAAVNPTPAAAQAPSCGDMYNRVMQLYQVAPQSPEYAQIAGAYSTSCLGASAGPTYSPVAGPGYYPPAYGPAVGYAPGYVYGPPVDIGIGVRGYGWRR